VIDTSKTIGTAETFDPERAQALLNKGVIRSITNLEKAIFSLEYLGQLQEQGVDLIFKGGSAVQILLKEKWNRLSVDVDICTDASEEELEGFLDKIYRKFNSEAFSYSPRERVIGSKIPFYLYRINTPTITQRSRTILLDAIGIKPKFATQQTPLKTFFFESSVSVTTPTVGSFLGDKLSTIGPTTIGRPLNDSRNGLEYAKHFYDINCLQETKFDMRECKEAFSEVIKIQSEVRGRDFSQDECFEDMLFTCQVASLPQQTGTQAIERLQATEVIRANLEFRILQDGLQRLQPFLVRAVNYAWDDLRSYAARTALILKIIKKNVPDDKVKKTLDADTPKSEEEILKIIKQIGSRPERERWFIQLDEIGNFPKMRIESRIISSSIDFYFEGLSVRKIQTQIEKLYNVSVSQVTVWKWIMKYSALVSQYVETLSPQLLGIYHVDETAIKCKGIQKWFWEIIDTQSKFLVASHLSGSRTTEDAVALFEKSLKIAKRRPISLYCDGLPAYVDGYNKVFRTMRADTRPEFIRRVGIRAVHNQNAVERLHCTLKDRLRATRGLKDEETVRTLLDGWVVHYNYVRKHQSLKGKTPAQASGINIKNDWYLLVKEATKYDATQKELAKKPIEVMVA
jgi:transposase-like protein